jgi:putative phosphoribosyl transferase
MREPTIGERVPDAYTAFADRAEAGRKLAQFLHLKPDNNAIVLALPRGGIPVGAALAQVLDCPLEPVFVRKLAIPFSPEAGFGAVALDGTVVLNDALVKDLRLPRAVIDSVVRDTRDEIQRRAASYAAESEATDVAGRDVYVVDDGLASGYTALAAERMIRRSDPSSLTLAVPTSPADTLDVVAPWYDATWCMIVQTQTPFAVASFYEDFHDLSDDEVREILVERRTAFSARCERRRQ